MIEVVVYTRGGPSCIGAMNSFGRCFQKERKRSPDRMIQQKNLIDLGGDRTHNLSIRSRLNNVRINTIAAFIIYIHALPLGHETWHMGIDIKN